MPITVHWGFFFVLSSLVLPISDFRSTFLPCLVSALVSFYFYFFLNKLLHLFLFRFPLTLTFLSDLTRSFPLSPLVLFQDHTKSAQNLSVANIKIVLPLQVFFFGKLFSQIVWKHMFSSLGLYFKYFLPLWLTLLTNSEKALIFV